MDTIHPTTTTNERMQAASRRLVLAALLVEQHYERVLQPIWQDQQMGDLAAAIHSGLLQSSPTALLMDQKAIAGAIHLAFLTGILLGSGYPVPPELAAPLRTNGKGAR